jgi:hypothetical protein
VLRFRSVIAGAVVLVGTFLMLPACSTTPTEAGPGCGNGARDDGEDGIDCGGICPTKCTGGVCTSGDQCASGKCENGVCGAPAGKLCGVGVGGGTQCNEGDPCELDKDCKTGFCDAAKCAVPSAESHSDGQKNGGETGIDCGGTVKVDKPCPDGQGCSDSTDCVGTCTNQVCGPIGPKDGKKNLDETDVDCGGSTAPKCANGKACGVNGDCADNYCPDTKKCTAPSYTDGDMNGTETDVECGGTGPGMKKCAETKNCLVDTDCNAACNYKKKCVDMPSCKGPIGSVATASGADTCGPGGPGTPAAAAHESCCKTLPVNGYTDPSQPGKTVYLDKYEITAGRMRAFLEALGNGVDAAGNAKPANVKAYMAANRPTKWNNQWEDTLPQTNFGSAASYTIPNGLLYPGDATYLTFTPRLSDWHIADGTQNIDSGVFFALGSAHFYTESIGGSPPGYGATHALNCFNGTMSYGYSTYWFDQATVMTYSGGTTGKFFSKEQLDEKSLTCAPFNLLAAFCAWDGGQLATDEVIDNITGNTISPVYSNGNQNGKLAPGQSNCGPGGGRVGESATSLITYSDGGTPCYPYFYPNDMGNTYDGSSRIAPPGRMPYDAIVKNVGDEPWMDLIGNLNEAVFKSGETARFDRRGYGHEYGSILYHKMNHSTHRGKGGAMGGRCMRFK